MNCTADSKEVHQLNLGSERVNKVGRCERFVLNTLFLSLVISLWQRSFQKYQQKNHYQKFPQKNLVCMSCFVQLHTVRIFLPFFVVPKSIYTHPIVDFLDLNCSFVSYYPFKDLFQVSWSISIVMMNLIHVTHGWCF